MSDFQKYKSIVPHKQDCVSKLGQNIVNAHKNIILTYNWYDISTIISNIVTHPRFCILCPLSVKEVNMNLLPLEKRQLLREKKPKISKYCNSSGFVFKLKAAMALNLKKWCGWLHYRGVFS